MVAFILALSALLHVSEAPITPFEPVEVEITVTHKKGEVPEMVLDSLPGAFFERVSINEEKSVIKLYIPQEKEGLNLLPPLTLRANGEKITIPPTTYEVTYRIPKEGLELRAKIVGKEPFYPGELLKVVYTIYYKGEISLTKEDLPLLHLKNAIPIGDIDVKEEEVGPYSLRTLSQEVKLLAPGDYAVGASLLEGVADGKRLRSEVIPFTLTVLPYPETENRLAFTGARGVFDLKAELLTEVSPLVLKLTFTGGESEVVLPDLFCQPGMSGFFTPGDPYIVMTREKEKQIAKVTLLPKTALAREIPPLTFTSFDPEKKRYVTVKTAAIPLALPPPTTVQKKKKEPFVVTQVSCIALPPPPSLLFCFTLALLIPLWRFLKREAPPSPRALLKRAMHSSGHERLLFVGEAIKGRPDRDQLMQQVNEIEWRDSGNGMRAFLQQLMKSLPLFLFFLLFSSFTHAGEELREALYENAELFAKAPYCLTAKSEVQRISGELGIVQPTLSFAPFLKNLSGWMLILLSNLLTYLYFFDPKRVRLIAGLLSLFLFVGAYALYFTPLQGVVMKGAASGERIIRSGQIVTIYSVDSENRALIDAGGESGYIPLETLKVIW